jgi:plasmid stabilization system protein ParE
MDRVAEIGAYIAEDNPSASEKWIRAIFTRGSQLSHFPESGRHIAETPHKDLRELVWGNYRVIYRIGPREVAILTVRHMKQILPIEELE